MNLKNIKNRLAINIRYADLDTYAHVNNKAFLTFLEDARIYYIKDVMNFMPSDFDYQAVVGRIDISYLAPLFLYDEAWVYTRCSRIGSKSYDLESYIIKMVDNKEIVASKAVVTMVSFDLKKGTTKPNDLSMMNSIKEYETIKPLEI